jgi:hypothetical protein
MVSSSSPEAEPRAEASSAATIDQDIGSGDRVSTKTNGSARDAYLGEESAQTSAQVAQTAPPLEVAHVATPLETTDTYSADPAQTGRSAGAAGDTRPSERPALAAIAPTISPARISLASPPM